MTECISPLPDDFYQQRQLIVRYSDLELSSDAVILLARQAAAPEQICRGLADGIDEWRDPNKIVPLGVLPSCDWQMNCLVSKD
jgi:hypothetical protein